MLWNANGLKKHQRELEVLLSEEKVDVCLISETHFTKESFIKFKNYELYHTIHPHNTARGGSAVIIRKNLKHHEEDKLSVEEFQATTVRVTANSQSLLITSVYSPPRHQIKTEQYKQLIQRHDAKFIMGGDFNAKNTFWGSRLSNPKGRELYKAIIDTGCDVLTTGTPTYWPTDPNKKPDLIDFFIVNKISPSCLKIENGFDLNSDHSPIIMTLYEIVVDKEPPPFLTNQHTDWLYFKSVLENSHIPIYEPINTLQLEEDVELVVKTIQSAAWESTPQLPNKQHVTNYPPNIKDMITLKRRLRKRWQQTRSPNDRTRLNSMSQKLSMEIKNFKNKSFESYLKELGNDKATDYSLWKSAKRLKRPTIQVPPIQMNNGQWAKTNQQKSELFSEYLTNVFSVDNIQSMEPTEQVTEAREGNEVTIPEVTPNEILKHINKSLKMKKCPGFDLITAEVLKNLPSNIIRKLAHIFNASFRLRYVPLHFKVAEVIMIPKPGKPLTAITSYRPISLLPILSKLYEKLLLDRLKPIIESRNIVPKHQFGFRNGHSTIDQVHRICNIIEKALEEKKVCSAVFLDVSQAFDKVCHFGLLTKLATQLPKAYCELIKSYLEDRLFRIKQEDAYSQLRNIQAGVPQGSILGPLLYLLYTSDVPESDNTIMATFADDTAILSVSETEEVAKRNLQKALNTVVEWTRKWRIKLNSAKSVQVDFTNKTLSESPILMENTPIPYANEAKYLGMTLDCKLRWNAHVKMKSVELRLKWRKMHWLMGRKSKLSVHNKIILYNQMLKPIWTYGAQLWGCTAKNNIDIIQRIQNQILRSIVNAPWYIRNIDLHRDLGVNMVVDEIRDIATKHDGRLRRHINNEASSLAENAGMERRLKRTKPSDLVRSSNIVP